jgi:hypothetical protein
LLRDVPLPNEPSPISGHSEPAQSTAVMTEPPDPPSEPLS